MKYKVGKVEITCFSVFDSLRQVGFYKNVCRLRKRGTDILGHEGC